MSRIKLLACCMGAAALATALSINSGADAKGNSGASVTSSLTAVNEVDDDLESLADSISHPDGKNDYPEGYAGLTVDSENATLRVAWKDEVPDWVLAKLKGSPSNIRAEAITVGNSLKELTDAADLLVSGQAAIPGVDVTSAWPEVGENGLSLTYVSKRDIDANEVAAQASKMTGVTVTGARQSGVVNLTREDNHPPWLAGGQMRHVSSSGASYFCSTGFAVELSNGADRLLSAGHCDWSGN